jgi:hypothetical protein
MRITISFDIELYITFQCLRIANIIVINTETSILLLDITSFKLVDETYQAIVCMFDV